MYEALKTALKSLRSNKLRSFLTLLGIVIGIYAVVTLLSLARGVQKQTTQAVEGFGPTLLLIMPGEDTGNGFSFASQLGPSTLFADDVETLREKVDLIDPESIGYAAYTAGALKKGDKTIAGLPMGGNPIIFEYLTFELIDGRTMTDQDMADKARVIFLTERGAEGVNAKVGDNVTLGRLELTVAGIFRVSEQGQIDPTAQDTMVIPATLATEINKSEQINQIMLKAIDGESVEAARDQIKEVLTESHGSADFTVSLPSDLLEQFNQITDILTIMVVGIAGISLLVGGIGISNIMLVTVTERTREIGIRKAVGATEGLILLQFLIEAVILTVFGALIGIAMAFGTGQVVAAVSPLTPDMSTEIILLAVGMAVLTGVIFGIFPAFRAARKHPVRALRYE